MRCTECGTASVDYRRSPETGRMHERHGWCRACYERIAARHQWRQDEREAAKYQDLVGRRPDKRRVKRARR